MIEAGSLYRPDKLRILDGVIHYHIRQQGGQLQPMTCRDTFDNRLFVGWVQVHDGYPGKVETT